ncbi:hypothetical protein Q4Q35_15040 [Flavivirga aquimarina]|uniref:SGNH/GDSL hydrolase family protein n=1 Tax=Flavivirga aquimarina TaxID=2027862 RepID=A0ABT8WDH5_9FLAO|nr:hypothetical protein [Flavivirga aquimarina]MDO5971122.1 hypothetical protein [Flavivirga aquimarina]
MKKFLLQIMGFIITFLLINILVGYYYNIPVKKSIENKTHKKYKKYSKVHDTTNTYNTIFLGSSRGYTAYNPVIFDSILDTKSFNMCTGSQNIIESYYILKDILEFQKPKTVVYEMFLPSFDTTDDYYHILSNASFLRSSKVKRELIVNGFGLSGIANYLSPILRNKLYIKADIMKLLVGGNSTVTKKKNNSYWVSGYLHEEKEVDQYTISNFERMVNLDNTSTSTMKLEYFNKLTNLCKEKGIQLVCVRSPFPPTRLNNEDDSDNKLVTQYFNDLCTQNNVEFFDFNSINNANYRYEDANFSDSHHMNYKGANKATMQLAELIKDYYEK